MYGRTFRFVGALLPMLVVLLVVPLALAEGTASPHGLTPLYGEEKVPLKWLP
ncbi:MAG: hypothetical protein JOZ69_16705, partial [Myxococcales bacterium]|nr:hypothetical protein [Myxococcales bacterium]